MTVALRAIDAAVFEGLVFEGLVFGHGMPINARPPQRHGLIEGEPDLRHARTRNALTRNALTRNALTVML